MITILTVITAKHKSRFPFTLIAVLTFITFQVFKRYGKEELIEQTEQTKNLQSILKTKKVNGKVT